MANLTVKEVVPPIEPIYEYTITLNQKEFEALMVLVGSIEGSYFLPLRQTTGKLWEDVFEEHYIKSKEGTKLEYFPKMKIGYSTNVK